MYIRFPWQFSESWSVCVWFIATHAVLARTLTHSISLEHMLRVFACVCVYFEWCVYGAVARWRCLVRRSPTRKYCTYRHTFTWWVMCGDRACYIIIQRKKYVIKYSMLHDGKASYDVTHHMFEYVLYVVLRVFSTFVRSMLHSFDKRLGRLNNTPHPFHVSTISHRVANSNMIIGLDKNTRARAQSQSQWQRQCSVANSLLVRSNCHIPDFGICF